MSQVMVWDAEGMNMTWKMFVYKIPPWSLFFFFFFGYLHNSTFNYTKTNLRAYTIQMQKFHHNLFRNKHNAFLWLPYLFPNSSGQPPASTPPTLGQSSPTWVKDECNKHFKSSDLFHTWTCIYFDKHSLVPMYNTKHSFNTFLLLLSKSIKQVCVHKYCKFKSGGDNNAAFRQKLKWISCTTEQHHHNYTKGAERAKVCINLQLREKREKKAGSYLFKKQQVFRHLPHKCRW